MKKSIIVVLSFLCSCTPQKKDYEQMSIDFIKANKGREQYFDILYETSNVDSRIYDRDNVSDPVRFASIFVYCDCCGYKKGDRINLPTQIKEVYSKNQFYGSENFYECKNGGKEDSTFFKSYINKFYKSYQSIQLPKYFGKTGYFFRGDFSNRFIDFRIDEHFSVLYIEDLKTLDKDKHWKDYFSHLKKVDDNWFYEVNEKK
jgi:hypothetical protein